jgi:hypothetical protein
MQMFKNKFRAYLLSIKKCIQEEKRENHEGYRHQGEKIMLDQPDRNSVREALNANALRCNDTGSRLTAGNLKRSRAFTWVRHPNSTVFSSLSNRLEMNRWQVTPSFER